jgi:hypothetical protein
VLNYKFLSCLQSYLGEEHEQEKASCGNAKNQQKL